MELKKLEDFVEVCNKFKKDKKLSFITILGYPKKEVTLSCEYYGEDGMRTVDVYRCKDVYDFMSFIWYDSDTVLNGYNNIYGSPKYARDMSLSDNCLVALLDDGNFDFYFSFPTNVRM